MVHGPWSMVHGRWYERNVVAQQCRHQQADVDEAASATEQRLKCPTHTEVSTSAVMRRRPGRGAWARPQSRAPVRPTPGFANTEAFAQQFIVNWQLGAHAPTQSSISTSIFINQRIATNFCSACEQTCRGTFECQMQRRRPNITTDRANAARCGTPEASR